MSHLLIAIAKANANQCHEIDELDAITDIIINYCYYSISQIFFQSFILSLLSGLENLNSKPIFFLIELFSFVCILKLGDVVSIAVQ